MKIRKMLVLSGIGFSLMAFSFSFAAEEKKVEGANKEQIQEGAKQAKKAEGEEEEEEEDEDEVADAFQIANQRTNDQFRELQRTGTPQPEEGPIRSNQYPPRSRGWDMD